MERCLTQISIVYVFIWRYVRHLRLYACVSFKWGVFICHWLLCFCVYMTGLSNSTLFQNSAVRSLAKWIRKLVHSHSNCMFGKVKWYEFHSNWRFFLKIYSIENVMVNINSHTIHNSRVHRLLFTYLYVVRKKERASEQCEIKCAIKLFAIFLSFFDEKRSNDRIFSKFQAIQNPT